MPRRHGRARPTRIKATATFQHFTMLPLELRQRIWELSIESRRIPVGGFPHDIYNEALRPPPAPPPAVFQVHSEARSYLKRYYTKAFTTESPSRYTWINFEIDTVFLRQWAIPRFWAELRSVRHLSIEIDDGESFYLDHIITAADCPFLESLELRPCNAGSNTWTREWDQYMAMCYYRDNPVHFRTTVVCPIPGHPVPELNPENYLKTDRDLVRKLHRKYPESWDSDFDPWESDQDPERCEAGWRHAPGCACPSSERWAPRFR